MATLVSSLAVLGGTPAFDHRLHVGCPNLGNRERLLERIGGLLDRRWLSNNGPLVQEFEQRITEELGVRHAVAMCNATVALETAIRALGMSGEVIVPSFTFVATAHALQWLGIAPIFCDIDLSTHNLDPTKVEQAITPRTTGIIGVHLWGRPCDTEGLGRIARRHGIPLLFDAAHAFGCSHGGRMVGGFGNAEVFSFHATKFLNSFEGGAVVTNDATLAERLRLIRNFGFAGFDNVVYLGTNAKMSEVAAAMGLTSLESLREFVAINFRNYRCYREALDGIPGVRMLIYNDREKCNFQYIVLEVDERESGIERDLIIRVLHAENIMARRYFYPGCHRMEPYRSQFPNAGLSLPITEQVASRVIVLPTGTAISPGEIEQIGQIIRTAVAQGDLITRRLAQ